MCNAYGSGLEHDPSRRIPAHRDGNGSCLKYDPSVWKSQSSRQQYLPYRDTTGRDRAFHEAKIAIRIPKRTVITKDLTVKVGSNTVVGYGTVSTET